MINWLSQQATHNGDREALIFADQSWTFRDLEAQSRQIAQRLIQHGLKPKVTVGVFMDNHANLVLLIHALCWLDCIMVPINPRLTAHDLAWQLQDCGASILIYDEAKANTVEQLKARASISGLIQYLKIADIVNLPVNLRESTPLESNWSEPRDRHGVQTIIYTSGTTGLPKGVQLTYSNHEQSAIATATHLGIKLGIEQFDRWLACLPLCHIGGLSIIWRSTIWGIPIILQPRFEVAAVCRAIAAHQVTLISLVPTMLVRILASTDFQPTLWQNLKGILLGGAAPTPELIRQCLELNMPIMPTYGLTEAASQVTTLLPQDLQRKFGSSGQPLNCDRLRIVSNDELAVDLPAGTIGQILVKGGNVMKGYINHSHTGLRDGWLYTGDLGYVDTEGYLYIVNRRSDLIISGGENIYPSEIEAILRHHPQIADVCVVGIADPEWGQLVGCAIVTKNGEAIGLAAIQQFCLEHDLARYKLPKVIYLTDSLPRTVTGKILRHQVLANCTQNPNL